MTNHSGEVAWIDPGIWNHGITSIAEGATDEGTPHEKKLMAWRSQVVSRHEAYSVYEAVYRLFLEDAMLLAGGGRHLHACSCHEVECSNAHGVISSFKFTEQFLYLMHHSSASSSHTWSEHLFDSEHHPMRIQSAGSVL